MTHVQGECRYRHAEYTAEEKEEEDVEEEEDGDKEEEEKEEEEEEGIHRRWSARSE